MDTIIQEEQRLFKYESEIYEQMRKIAGRLNTIVIEPILRFKLVDRKTGRVKLKRERHSHSYVRNAFVWQTMAVSQKSEGSTYADGDLGFWRTSDTFQGAWMQSTTPESSIEGFYHTVAGVDDRGIIVGRDATAEDFDDWELGNPITDGTGPNQLEYIAMTKSEGWNGGSSYYWSSGVRPLDNNTVSPATITVYEVALFYEVSSSIILIARDIDAGGVAVPNGDRLYVEYETRVSFP